MAVSFHETPLQEIMVTGCMHQHGQKTCKTYHVSHNPICCNHQILTLNEADLVQVKKAKTINIKRGFGTKLLPENRMFI